MTFEIQNRKAICTLFQTSTLLDENQLNQINIPFDPNISGNGPREIVTILNIS